MEGTAIVVNVTTGELSTEIRTYPDRSLLEIKTEKERDMRSKGTALMLQITAPYAPEERDTWATQVTEAHAYHTDPNTETAMLTALCTQRGNTVADQVSRILANEAAFKIAVGTVLGVQQAKLDAIQAATTVEEVNAIVWEA